MKLHELNKPVIDEAIERAWGEWDEQLNEDLQAGKLDHLLEELDAELAAGQLEPL